jgi:hypothetical protein
MAFSIAHWSTLDDSFIFDVQEEDNIEHDNGKWHVFTF